MKHFLGALLVNDRFLEQGKPSHQLLYSSIQATFVEA